MGLRAAVLDAGQVERALAAVTASEAARATALAELPVRLAADRAAVDHVFAHLDDGDVLRTSLAHLLV